MAQSSDEEDSVSANGQGHQVHPQSTGPTNAETRSETQDKNSFQDHHTLSDEEVFSISSNMMVAEMLHAGFLMLKQGQQLFHSINSAMLQRTKSLEMMEEKQARSLVAIEASNRETKDAIQSLTQQVSAQGEAVEFAHGRINDMEQDLKAFKDNVYGGIEGVIKNHNKLIRTIT